MLYIFSLVRKYQEIITRVAYIAVSVSPFLSLYIFHWINTPEGYIPTGFIQSDMPYYAANGREIFESGNGFSYPNPYDTSPTKPDIYFHWFPWLLGVGIKFFNIDPGILFFVFGIVSSVLCAWLTLIIVEKILPNLQFRYPLFLLVMWGGGVLCLSAVVANLFNSESPSLFTNILRYDPFGGMWFLNWGRNLIYPTEATYHAIVALIWIAVLNQRWWLAVFGTVGLATTHPFSGVQHLLIMIFFLSIVLVIYKSPKITKYWITLSITLVIFLLYYKVFLVSFPEHQAIHKDWSLNWVLPIESIFLAYSPVGILAIMRIIYDRRRLPIEVLFFATCFLTSLLLAKHELFMDSMQPLHFTRGYLWTPLIFIALPFIQRGLISLQQRMSNILFMLISVILASFAIGDNLVFVKLNTNRPLGYYLTFEERNLLTQVNLLDDSGIMLTLNRKLGYLSATYTSVTPYVGHHFLTPKREEKLQNIKYWKANQYDLLEQENIDYILIKIENIPSDFDLSKWDTKLKSKNYILLVKQ